MFITSDNKGWNAGARSIQTHSGDCVAQFSVEDTISGVACGLCTVPTFDNGYASLSHALKFYSDVNGAYFYVSEFGEKVSRKFEFATTDVFNIRRIGKAVEYFKNGLIVHTSARPSRGTVYLGASLFKAGDKL